MTTNEDLGAVIHAYQRAGSIQQQKVRVTLGLTDRPDSPDAGRPYAPPQGIAEAQEAGE